MVKPAGTVGQKSLHGALQRATKEPKFKPHVGRMFKLRKVEEIEVFEAGMPAWGNGQRTLNRKKDLGEVVMVFDETNTRVSISTVDGVIVWISKFYLGLEIANPARSQSDTIESVVKELMGLSEKALGPERIENLSEKLHTIANQLRVIK